MPPTEQYVANFKNKTAHRSKEVEQRLTLEPAWKANVSEAKYAINMYLSIDQGEIGSVGSKTTQNAYVRRIDSTVYTTTF